MNINQLKNALPYLFKTKITPLVIGTHGVGKTSGVKQFCDENGFQFLSFRLGQLADAGDMTGLPSIENGVTEFLRPAWWPTEGKGVIFLDEINRARRDLLQCVFELCEKGTMNGRVLPEGWHVAAAMNPDTDDYTVTDCSDKAFLDRFCAIKISSSHEDFINYGRSKSFNKSVLSFIGAQPGMLRGNNQDFTLKFVEPSDRSWEKVGLLANLYDSGEMPETILNELVAGLVGLEASTAYMSWKKTSEKPVEGAKVLADYSSVQKTIKDYGDPANYRSDLLNETKQQVIEILKAEGKTITPSEYENLVTFMLDLPNDVFYDLNKQMFRIPQVFLKLVDETRLYPKIQLCEVDKQTVKKNEPAASA